VTIVTTNSTWAASDTFERLCLSANDTAPIFVFRDGNGTVERMDIELFDTATGLVDVTPNGRSKAIRAKYTKLNKAEIDEVCATTGISVAVLPKQNGKKMAESSDATESAKALTPMASIPSSFTISTSAAACKNGVCTTSVYGNFWVPGTMPATDNAHLSQFTVTTNNFHNAVNSAHFVNSLLTVSDTNFDSDFDGKGVIFGPDPTYCGSASNPAYGSLTETWLIGLARPEAVARKFNGVVGTYTGAPNTCSGMTANGTYRFLAGANRQQQFAFYRYPGSSTTPDYPPPGSNFAAYNVSDVIPSFRVGGSGVAFFVAGGGQISVPQTQLRQFSLTFSNVSAWTQP
jgi:hypothetical protein